MKKFFSIVFYNLYIFYAAQETSAVLGGLGRRDAVKKFFLIVFNKLYIFYGAQETWAVFRGLGRGDAVKTVFWTVFYRCYTYSMGRRKPLQYLGAWDEGMP